ncbi:MAG: PriCT-2 domain-containing protein [Planctomycetes bacterium]|nr:PriCT-2 domain-containing protein [Planctomycetota bacterium]
MSAEKQARPGGDQGAWGNSRGRNSAGTHSSSQAREGQDATVIQIPPKAWEHLAREEQRPLEIAREALTRLSPRRADDFDQVRIIGRILHGVSAELYGDWVSWAATHQYTAEYCATVWASFAKSTATPVGLGLLISFVRKDSGDTTFGKRGGA